MFLYQFNLFYEITLLLNICAMFSNSVIGNFVKVVYMDEPSTGLDPASRKNLWNVVNRAKQDRAIILTSNFFLPHGF